ncbi:Eco29kI family restriction endonuclease [Sphingomonas sp. QA11]|uniref:Eco29kI family restriction endonuclease n=1 Tax=Sphingomonas sp. QA11 TaxID=2950605 RepID=UPI00234946C8|nr:Eco29kI family restriction endonuclease [Sphingomonas sp. QA11]WCM28369.1 Eco29kI family restriction endonuclease [Sphingomonas sp. QA11]
MPDSEFDPLAVENVGVTLAVQLLEQPTTDFPPPVRFNGPGVYALYYTGTNPAYAPLVELDDGRCTYPVYVGRAARENKSQGFSPRASKGEELYKRIKKHYDSVIQTSNINAADFKVRYLVLKPAYINLAESVLIMAFRPPWNGMGLGSNVTGGPRMAGKGSLWDSLHPGRKGRPAGSDETAKLAADLIAERVAELHKPSSDAIIRDMHERIMKFV